jgi:hypothetical protein
MSARILTPQDILQRGVCEGVQPCMQQSQVMELFAGKDRWLASEVLETKMPAQRRLWVVLHPTMLSPVELMTCALAFAREAFSRHQEALSATSVFADALTAYDDWLAQRISTARRDAACAAAELAARNLMKQRPRRAEVAAAWAIVGAGAPRSFDAAKLASYKARCAEGHAPKAAHRQVALVQDILHRGIAAQYTRDVAASEALLAPAKPSPMYNDHWVNVSLQNLTSHILQGGTPTSSTGNSYILQDAVPPSSAFIPVAQGIGTSCAEGGCTGTAPFTFGNGQILVFMWHVPFDGAFDDTIPYFYALLQGSQPGQYQTAISPSPALYYCEQPTQSAPEPPNYPTQVSVQVTLSNITN